MFFCLTPRCFPPTQAAANTQVGDLKRWTSPRKVHASCAPDTMASNPEKQTVCVLLSSSFQYPLCTPDTLFGAFISSVSAMCSLSRYASVLFGGLFFVGNNFVVWIGINCRSLANKTTLLLPPRSLQRMSVGWVLHRGDAYDQLAKRVVASLLVDGSNSPMYQVRCLRFGCAYVLVSCFESFGITW